MPPVGKPQLDEEETAILFQWIKGGASFKQKVIDLPPTDSLRLLANTLFEKGVEESYDFSAASEKDIKKLNNTNRLIHPIALGLPALAVNFYNRQNYTSAALPTCWCSKHRSYRWIWRICRLRKKTCLPSRSFPTCAS